MVERRFEAFWHSSTDVVNVREVGDWIHEARPNGIIFGHTPDKDRLFASGYASTPKLATLACEQNRDAIVLRHQHADENAIVEGM